MNSPLPHHAAAHAPTSPEQPAEEGVRRRRTAVSALGREVRALVDATVRTTAAPDALLRVAEGVRALAAQLTGDRRARADIPVVDEFPGGVRMYSPVTGTGTGSPPRRPWR
ncbi:hypothetical protein OR263_14095 [Streptomyces sp. NEAU-H22]|uniref:hypothetical protein n=1 Tax=unclassified Streptomyces TaxID=2593676 RepID=UPI00224E3CB2|nr:MULTISPECIES: hypothetical protein [unclassified Streptomyces]MCX3287822.1 hypothetical protein [Streptomyces sp. NEAU-H22]WMD06103.1 hypothetical protein Q7C01_17575 [Streptomyces sp. FXY-T5]